MVICDIGLPGMDGHQVARAIRAAGGLPTPRLVAFTGYAAPDEAARSREAGFDAHLVKPATFADLARALVPGEKDLRRSAGHA